MTDNRQAADDAANVGGDYRVVSRPTEDIATRRAANEFLLRAYLKTGLNMHLEAYIERVGDGNTFDDDFPVRAIPGAVRPALLKGCVSCGGRFEEASFRYGAKQPNGTISIVHSHYCENCRDRKDGKRWWNLLAEDAKEQPQGVGFRVIRGRDNVKGARPKSA